MNCIPVINMTATGKNIMRLRKNTGMTVKDLQDVFGFTTPQAIYKWQRGTAMPTLDNMVALAAVFGVTIDEIIAVQNQPQLRVSAYITALETELTWSLRLTGQVVTPSRWKCSVRTRQGSPYIPDWCNGSTPDSDSDGRGSNP